MNPAVVQRQLRVVLNHLYDRDLLRQSALVDVFQLDSAVDQALALQQILIQAIEGLKPVDGEPHYAEKRKVYDILVYRYIEQFKQAEVAHNIGVSIRQFRREQEHAVEALFYSLADRYHLALIADSTHAPTPPSTTSNQGQDAGRTAQPEMKLASHAQDWAWILNSRGDWVTGARMVTLETLDLIRPVANELDVTLQVELQEALPDLAVHPVAFRQILLNVVRLAIDQAKGGGVIIRCAGRPPLVCFHFQVEAIPHPMPATTASSDSLLEIARELAHLSGGTLDLRMGETDWQADLALPMIDGLPVLVVDDNHEIISLLARYTSGTRYRVVGVADPLKAIDIAQSSGARIAVLDVMMPHMDGWELLGRFRSHPDTAHIPVIILTILSQEDLARALGARMLVLKPVKQETFLAALDEVAAELY